MLVDVARLVTAYYAEKPDPGVAAQRVSFGTSGHRGSSFDCSFNENHILAITQAICEYRREQGGRPAVSRARTPTRSPSRPSAARWRCWRPMGSDVVIDQDLATPRRPPSRTPS